MTPGVSLKSSFLRAVASLGRGEYSSTFAAEFAVVIAQVVVYKMAADLLGREGFAAYALARRTVAVIQPVLVLGLGVALPRYLAYDIAASRSRLRPYFGAAVAVVFAACAFCTLLMNVAGGAFAFLFFGSRQYVFLVFPLTLMLWGLSAHALVYANFRGKLAMTYANILQLLNMAAVPLLAFLLFHSSVQQVMVAMGIGWIVTSVVLAAFRAPLREVATPNFVEMRELLRYGVQRVPGDFVHMALLTLPSTIVSHLKGMEAGGFVAFGTAMLTMISSAFSPISLVLLPKASRMLGEGSVLDLRTHVRRLVQFSVLISVAMVLLLEIFAGLLIRLYLGPGFPEVATIVRIVALGAVPYCIYVVLRGLVDAFHTNAVIALILVGGFLVFLIGSTAAYVLVLDYKFILFAYVLGLSTLGIVTTWESKRILAR